MNTLILVSFMLTCVGCALAGYGSGTPGYYDPWTYYGGYDRYYDNRYNYGNAYQTRPYYPISRGSYYDSQYNRPRLDYDSQYIRPRSSYSATRYNGYSRGYNRPSYGRSTYNRASYDDYYY